MKISTITGAAMVILTSIITVLTANSVTAQWTAKDSLLADNISDRQHRINQSGDRNITNTVKNPTPSLSARISKKTAVMYIKDETIDTGNLLEAMENKNIEIGFAEAGEEVTIIEQTEKMQKVRFNLTGRLGWVSPKYLLGL